MINKQDKERLFKLGKEYNFNYGELYLLCGEFGLDTLENVFKYRNHVLHKDSLYNICEEYLTTLSSYYTDRLSEQLESKTY